MTRKTKKEIEMERANLTESERRMMEFVDSGGSAVEEFNKTLNPPLSNDQIIGIVDTQHGHGFPPRAKPLNPNWLKYYR